MSNQNPDITDPLSHDAYRRWAENTWPMAHRAWDECAERARALLAQKDAEITRLKEVILRFADDFTLNEDWELVDRLRREQAAQHTKNWSQPDEGSSQDDQKGSRS